MYKLTLFLMVTLLSQPLVLMANEVNEPITNPMRPPAYALQKHQQAKNKNNPKFTADQQKKADNKDSIASNPEALAKPKTPKLTSILYSSTRKIAILDQKMLKVGDSINGAKLISIKQDSVQLLRAGKKIKLLLSNQSIDIQKTVVLKTIRRKKL